jgi:NADH-quinone oxidoreductase subunit G
MSEDLVTIEVDGRKLEARKGSMLIDATDAAGIYIPRFCYHKKLSVAANCRMCLVEVERAPKPQPACATPVMDGMKVFTKSEKAISGQQATMEFLLINHPLDCPICDQGGECELQDLAMGYGSDVSQYVERKRVVRDKDIGPLVQTDMTRCIHCTRCVRFGEEIAGLRELGATGRGEHMEIGTYVQHAMSSELSGNVIDLCPVGALTSKPYRYSARAWELQQREGVAPHDCLGSNLNIHVKGQVVKRVVPRENEAVNETWIADRDRFSYQGLKSEQRLLSPRIKQDGQWRDCDWETAFSFIAGELSGLADQGQAQRIGALASPSSTSEELFLLQRLARGLGSANVDHRLRQVDFSGDAADATVPGLACGLDSLEQADAVLIVGGYPRHDQPLLGHRIRKAALRGAKVFVVDAYAQPYNFNLAGRVNARPADYAAVLAGISRAAAEQAGDAATAAALAAVEVSAAQRAIADALRGAERSFVIAATELDRSAQRADLMNRCASLAALTGSHFGQATDGANAAGAALAGALPHRGPAGAQAASTGKSALDMLGGGLDAYLLLGLEPDRDCADPVAALAALGAARCVVALTAFAAPSLVATAHVMLPIAAFAENEGSFVNASGVWQRFTPAVKAPGEARPAWKILRVLGERLGLDGFDAVDVTAVTTELQALCAGLAPSVRAASGQQAPQAVSGASGLELLRSLPLYAGDALVRRAPALQATVGAADNLVRVASGTAAQLGLAPGAMITVETQGVEARAELAVDDGVPPQCCVVHIGSDLAARLPRASHVNLRSAS